VLSSRDDFPLFHTADLLLPHGPATVGNRLQT
jgi:hypothetical protein